MSLSENRNISVYWTLLVCCVLTVVIYLPGLSGDYMFDDNSNLLSNQALAIESLDLHELSNAAFSSRAGNLRRPVSMGSFALNHYFFGINPYSYKLINLVIHLLTGLALFLLARLIVDSYRQLHNTAFSPRIARWLPVVVCGLWLVHPLNLTSVLYIVQRMTSLSSLFMVCALCLYMIGRRKKLAGRHGLTYILTGFIVFGGLAIFSKETGILLPLYMLVLELTLFRFRNQHGQIDRSIAILFGVIFLLPMIAGTLYLAAHFDTYINYNRRDFTLSERLLTEARVLVFYLKMILLPTTRELGLYHDDFRLSTGLLNPATTLYSYAFLAGLLAIGLWLIRRQPLVSLGILWFFAGHMLESTIIPLELVHEHRNYLPDFGIILAVAAVLANIRLQRLAPVIHVAAPVLLLVVYASTTWVRSMQWSDNINHAIYEAKHHPNSTRAVFAAGRIHGRLAMQGVEASIEEAYRYLQHANQLDSTGIMPAVTLVKLGYLLDRAVDPQLFEEITYRLANYPLTPSDITSLQDLADCMGNPCDVPQEIFEKIFSTALKNNNPRLLTVYAFYTINKRGDFHKGLELFEQVVELAPNKPQHWKNLINLLIVMARFDDAGQRLDQFRTLKPLGSNESTFRIIQEEIETGRKHYSAANSAHEGNS